jgi:acetylornithine deacetylase/succinyl-diaminopimelate desuccinylase-like protein
MIPEESPEQVEAELKELIQKTAARYKGIEVTIRRILLAQPLTPRPGSARLADLICRHATRIMGERVEPQGVPLYTDARHYAAAGIPIVLYGAGPHTIEQANAHRADERLPLSDLYKATEVIALTLSDLLGS